MNSTNDEQVWIEKYRAALTLPAQPAKISLGSRVTALLADILAAVKSNVFKRRSSATTLQRRPPQSTCLAEIEKTDLKSQVLWRINVNGSDKPQAADETSRKAG